MANVLILFGGKSAEHEVSCVSAVAIARAVRESGHEPLAVGIDRHGGWHLADASRDPLEAKGPEVELRVPGASLVGSERVWDIDVVFPVLHGPFGEDGTVQGLFEVAGIPYVGAGVLASAIAMDKDVAKRLLLEAGVPVARHLAVRRADFDGDPAAVVARVAELIGFPVFVKPAALGSSVGVSPAADEGETKDSLLRAFRHGDKALVEESVEGREIEVAVLEGPRTSVPGEIIPAAGWYDYESKYADDSTILEIPAQLSEPETVRVRELAARTFTVLEVAGLARIDFFYEESERGFVVNEVNTMPGFTPRSMFPLLWEASGMAYRELVGELIDLALTPG